MTTMQPHTTRTSRTSRSIIFIVLLLVVALLAWGGLQFAAADDDSNQVKVIDGEGETHILSLSQNGEFTFATSLGTNTIKIENGSVSIVDADCPGHDCIDQGVITNSASMIVCMPHKLVVSITEEGETA